MSPKALLVCSRGGHLLQMLSLEAAWGGFDVSWVTLPGSDVDHLLDGRRVDLARGPTNRSLVNLVRNAALAWKVVRRERPEVILSTGAALAVPFFFIGRLHGCRLVYVESLTRTSGLSLSGWMVYPLADAFFVQWPEVAARYRRAIHAGSLL